VRLPPGFLDQLEISILGDLQFKTNIPTAIEFIQYLLIMSNTSSDFSSMIEESAKYAYISIIDNDLCTFKASSIAIASVLMMTENKGFLNFRRSWFDFVKADFPNICFEEI